MPFGFQFVLETSGKGSGGEFASGSYRRDDRRLELHFRYSLGLVTYHIGDDSLGHEEYMRFLGVFRNNRYPDFPKDPLDSFENLASDLKSYCSDFLSGAGDQFGQFTAELRRNPNKFVGVP